MTGPWLPTPGTREVKAAGSGWPLCPRRGVWARAGGEGLRVTGRNLTAYFVAINSPSSLASRLSTSVSQQGHLPAPQPGLGAGGCGGEEARPPGGEDHPPRLASLLFQSPLRARTLFPVIADAQPRRGEAGRGEEAQSGRGTQDAATTSHRDPRREERRVLFRPPSFICPPTSGGLSSGAARVQPRSLRPRLEVSPCTPGAVPPRCRHLAKSQAPRIHAALAGRREGSSVPRVAGLLRRTGRQDARADPRFAKGVYGTGLEGGGRARRGHMLARSRCSREL